MVEEKEVVRVKITTDKKLPKRQKMQRQGRIHEDNRRKDRRRLRWKEETLCE